MKIETNCEIKRLIWNKIKLKEGIVNGIKQNKSKGQK